MKWLTVSQAAELFRRRTGYGLTYKRLLAYLSQGRLASARVGAHFAVPDEEIEAAAA